MTKQCVTRFAGSFRCSPCRAAPSTGRKPSLRPMRLANSTVLSPTCTCPAWATSLRLDRLPDQQRSCSTQIGRIEPFGEALVDRRQEVPRIVMTTLGHPQSGKAEGNAQLPEQGALLTGDFICRPEAILRL